MQNTSYRYHLDPEVRCLFIRCYGVITKQVLFDCAAGCRVDPEYENDFSVLNDYTHCTFQASPADLRELAAYMNSEWPTTTPIKAAVIIDSKLAHGLGRMYEVYSGSRAVEPKLFHHDQPNLVSEIQNYFNLPENYQFSDLFNF